MGAVQRFLAGPGRRTQFHDRDEIRRIDRVRDQATVPAGQVLGEQAGRNAGGGTADDGQGFRRRVQRREQRALDLQVLGRIFLDIAGALERVR
ncbi:hypothetical protein D9M69_703560 [compost metagenome]